MRHGPSSRIASALLALLLAGNLAVRTGLTDCPMHPVHKAMTASGHAGHVAGHMGMGAHHEGGKPAKGTTSGCDCLAGCQPPTALRLIAPQAIPGFPVARIVATVLTPPRSTPSLQAHLFIPFSNGPPRSSLA